MHVRVRDGGALRERVEVVGSHADVAMRAGLSPARLSQLLSEVAPVIKLAQAVRLEEVLGAAPGTFFAVDDPDANAELISAYLGGEVPSPSPPVEDQAVSVQREEG